jgi:hypothetical protein
LFQLWVYSFLHTHINSVSKSHYATSDWTYLCIMNIVSKHYLKECIHSHFSALRLLSSGMWYHAFWYIFRDVLGKIVASILEAAYSSEILVNIYQIALCHILKGSNLHGHWCENLKIPCFISEITHGKLLLDNCWTRYNLIQGLDVSNAVQ